MEVLKKILNIIIDIFIVLVVIVSALIAVVSITARDSGVANLFGYVPFSVQSNSMSPVFETGDLIVGKLVPKEQRVPETFHEGDIVTFWTSTTNDKGVIVDILNTHRIIEVKDHFGVTVFITKGDNNDIKDQTFVNAESIVSVWSTENKDDGIMMKKVGSVLDYLRKPSGFFIAVVIPMIIFFIYELVRFITNFLNYNKEKQKEAALQAAKDLMGDTSSDSSGLSEDQKAQAILEYLEKQKAEQEESPPDAPEASEAEEAQPEPEAEEVQPAAEEQPQAEDSTPAEETEQPATAETEAVTEPEQETAVSEATED